MLACPHCGYDLTGLRTNTCPECGEPFRIVAVRPDPRPARRLPAVGLAWLGFFVPSIITALSIAQFAAWDLFAGATVFGAFEAALSAAGFFLALLGSWRVSRSSLARLNALAVTHGVVCYIGWSMAFGWLMGLVEGSTAAALASLAGPVVLSFLLGSAWLAVLLRRNVLVPVKKPSS